MVLAALCMSISVCTRSLITRDTPGNETLCCARSSSSSAHTPLCHCGCLCRGGHRCANKPLLTYSLHGAELWSTGIYLTTIKGGCGSVNLLCPLPVFASTASATPKERVVLAGWGDGWSLPAMRALLVSRPGPFKKCSVQKSVSASSAADLNFLPNRKVYLALSLWNATCPFHTLKKLCMRLGKSPVLGHSWEPVLGSLRSQISEGDCLDRSLISGLWKVTHGFADK